MTILFWNVDAMMWQYNFQMEISGEVSAFGEISVFGGAPMLMNVNDDIIFMYFSSHINNRR